MSRLLRLFICCAFLLTTAFAQDLATREDAATGLKPNADATYQQLRNVALGTEYVPAAGMVLKRDAATFTFKSGAFCFTNAVEGKVTGAVFVGEGTFSMTPPTFVEQRSLSLLTNGPSITEEFNSVVFRFTDDTYDEVKKLASATGAAQTCAQSVLADNHNVLRKKLKYNLAARIMQDVAGAPGGLFMAFINGRKYSGKMVYVIDPRGVPAIAADIPLGLEPEEVALLTWDDMKLGLWAAFHLAPEYADRTFSRRHSTSLVDILHQQLDTSLEKNGKLSGTAATTFRALVDGVRVVPFELYPRLRVVSVTDSSGQALNFIQEDQDDDAQFSVVLPRALKAGEEATIRTTYSGKEAVTHEGGGNYYVVPAARTSWYPNSSRFDDYATYEMRFSAPKGLMTVATGEPLGEVTEGDQAISKWKSEGPLTVAGFNVGRFKKEEKKLEKQGFVVESFANREQPDIVKEIQRLAAGGDLPTLDGPRVGVVSLGSMNTTTLMKKAMAEAELAIPLYTDYFGPVPYRRIAITQQAAFNYGQAWPSLVWLPITYFFDSTVRHQLGMDDPKGYFSAVGPHEIAHQWWGHAVTWSSYRDQWMSEGFSELSASIFLQLVRGPNDFRKFWRDNLDELTQKNQFGYRAIDVGPLTVGYRLATSKTADVPRRLIYPKGGFVLHMVRMMMWNPRGGDERFKKMMQDFVKTFSNQPASTEDFKATVEKHMTAEMDLAGDRKMDWFFDSYVYGTALPNYQFQHDFATGADGGTVLNLKITQSNVDSKFRMRVPIYIELADGRVTRLGAAPMTGNESITESIPLGKLPRPKRAMINHYYDVLATMDGN